MEMLKKSIDAVEVALKEDTKESYIRIAVLFCENASLMCSLFGYDDEAKLFEQYASMFTIKQ